ncbi:hypothetical protein FDP41_003045 [Naegleria fowleri]|uniref:RRM domain-containing protein n=1 Tax=Naegleria fowleri TaxID=5763 RepID=A0A6A5BIJ7_NAEFO|nr:uncharacterized protein FDP41_003045 [Naegleria fowleri]KAF0977723.1 hypothetical protein FDP41_003045 [Naegleria fowleri]CAG4709068.1 unnamed protein product [Naegleria fowleri]
MPRRKTIDDDMDETYEDENDSQSSDNFSDLVDEEEETSSAPTKSSATINRTSEPTTTSSTTTTGPKKRGRKPKNEPKPKKAPTGRPRGRPRKHPIVVTTPTPTKPISPMEDTHLDGGLLSLGQAAVLALNDADLDPSSIKAEEDLVQNLTTPISPATPLYPLKKRFLATMSQEGDKAAETTTTTPTKPPTPPSATPAVVEPAQPVKRRPGRPRKADKLQQQQQQQTTQDKKETAKDDSVKMTSRQQILYLKKLEEKKESDSEVKEAEEEEEEKEEEPISLEFDSDESVEVKKPKKTSKRKLVKKKSSPWTKVEKITVKYKGRTLGSFDVSLLGSDSSFELDVGSTVEVNQKIALDKVEDIESSSFYILSFSSRSKSEEEKLEEMYNILERENCVGSISFDDRILLFIPKKSRFLKPLGLTEVQDDPSKFIGALMMKDESSPERTSKKNKKTSSSSSTPILTTPKSPTSHDEDIKKKQLSLLSIPKIPKTKATSSTPTGETPLQMENAYPTADVKPLDSSVSSLLNAIAAVTPTSYTPTNVRTPTMPPTAMNVATSSMSSNSPPGYTMYSNLPKNAAVVGTEMPVMPPSNNIPPGMTHMSQQPPPPPQSNLYEKPPQIPQDGNNYQQTMPQQLGRYPPQDNAMPPNYPPHNMVPDQYSHSTSSSNYPPMHMQQQAMPPGHTSMPMDMRGHYENYDNELKRKRMTSAYAEPQTRPISPKRRKDVPYGVQYSTYQSSHHDVSPIPMPSSASQPPPPPHEIYHRSYPSSPIRKPPPPSSVPPPPSSPPPMVSSSSHHTYSGGPTSGFSRSNAYPPHSYQPQQTSPPIVPPRRPDSANFGYSNKPYSKPYYKEDTYHDEYDRSQRPYKKYGDDRYQPGTGGPMGSYNRRPDNYSNVSSYSNMDDYNGGDSYYRKPHHYNNGPRRSYNAPNIPEVSSKNVPTTDVQPPPPPPPDVHGENVNMDYNEKEDNIPEATEPTRHLWVGRFHNMKMDYTTIHSDFEKFGPIDSLNLLRDQKCAFVNFAHVKDAIRAKKELEGTKKYRKIAYQRREKKSSTFSSDFKKNVMPYHKNDYNNYHHGGGDHYRHTDQQ